MPETATQNPFAPAIYELKKERSVRFAHWGTFGISILLLLPVVAILAMITINAWPVISWSYLTNDVTKSGAAGGIWGPLIGTFYLTLLCLIIVAPIGILAGIYLTEYAPDNKFTRSIMVAVTSLAGVPSIVHALFGLGAFIGAMDMQKGMLTAAMTLSVMTLPVIITSTREALAGVPRNFREACWNLGASRWQTIRTIVLPNSFGGILTGVILVIARAAGETAPIMFMGAVLWVPIASEGMERLAPYGINEEFMAMSNHLNLICKDIPGMSSGMKFGSAFILLAMILAINGAASVLRSRLRRRKRW
ncbi:MAG TPA: phosphate ABC transporter permease PstA [Verrucomicrobiales bacterium]|jgi:phosphate transport system permease protein|nr:phosphate ABC transporter permease PstA [Verrucomicrobiales bacterium]